MTGWPDSRIDPFAHQAFLYQSRDDFVAGSVPFLEKGLAQDEPVLAATVPANLSRLRAALGTAVHRVALVDICQAGRNPGRILPGILVAFARAHPGQRVRILCEPVWRGRGRGRLAYPACVQHEALVNTAFAGTGAAIRCAYDRQTLPPAAIDDAEITHPVVVSPGGSGPSPRFVDPLLTVQDHNQPLPRPPADATSMPVAVDRLAKLRQFVSERAEAAGLPQPRVADAIIAANELASNTIDHTRGPGTLTCWSEAEQLVCQVEDTGYITDPLAGRLPPVTDALAGRGLYVVNELCDLVRVHTAPGGTSVRIQLGPGEGVARTPW